MSRPVLSALAGFLLLLVGGATRHSETLGPAAGMRSPLSEVELLALEQENGCVDESAGAAVWPPNWCEAIIAGGDVQPTRVISDPYPTLHSVAVDAENNRVVMSDPNRHALWSYDRLAASKGREATIPLTSVRGPATGMMFVAAVTLYPEEREMYSVDNDIGDRMMVFSYDDNGNVKPKRILHVPHQAWGISINGVRDEIAITVEAARQVVIYKRTAQNDDKPLRIIRGPKTGLGDPHGVYFDGANNEIVVANHGNHGGRQTPPGDITGTATQLGEVAAYVGGKFEEPSIAVYAGDVKGDVPPLRRIQGAKTGLNWPMALDVDVEHNEIAVANNGDSSIRIFRRADSGNVAPIRAIKGPRTGINGPMGVAYDVKNDELWVSNYGEHTAVVFPRGASGDVAPSRTLRTAPAGSPTVGFGNPGAVAYDSRRDEILVPN